MSAALLIDFGSTYTKLRAVDLDARRILGAGQGPSTVTTDINVGMLAALRDLERRLGRLPRFRYRLASSSAAGGLRMVTVGLVRELTAEAARRAALGAGAKLVGTFAYRLTAADLQRIAELAPDILLLAGGTDGGNSEVILHNAAALARAPIDCPIVYAGNRAALDAAREAGIPSVVDPKFRHFLEFGGATVFKPNVLELGAAMGGPVRPHDDEWLEHARRRVGARHLLLTLGEEGMALRSEGASTLRIPAMAREV
ncbi:MAG TPA: glutamate mutase L, partial [Burkholderiales bacterium]